MTQETIHKFKDLLEVEKKSLIHAMSALGVKNIETGEWEATPDMSDGEESDANDLADRSEDFEERTATLATLDDRLREVDHALAKVTAGTYGVCDISGEEIEEERLMANPAATTCIAHME